MATDVESLYATVKSLVCVVKNNKAAANEMDKTRGYQVWDCRVGFLLKRCMFFRIFKQF